jgi:hypothetical protein
MWRGLMLSRMHLELALDGCTLESAVANRVLGTGVAAS